MSERSRVLVQTTVPKHDDDWSVERVTLLCEHLASLEENGTRFEVAARNRETPAGTPDAVLSGLGESSFDQLWLFALDLGDGLTPEDCAGITRFRQRGGGILATRDHQDMGSSLCTLGGIGRAHFFQTQNPDPDVSRHVPDDRETPTISWPNYHSGRNGDVQRIRAVEPLHELLVDPAASRAVSSSCLPIPTRERSAFRMATTRLGSLRPDGASRRGIRSTSSSHSSE